MHPGGPRWAKLRARRQEGEQPGRRALLQQEPEPLQRRRVGPVQILPDSEHRLPLGLRHQPGDQGRLRPLLLPLRTQVQWRVGLGHGSDNSAANKGTTSGSEKPSSRSLCSSLCSFAVGVSSR